MQLLPVALVNRDKYILDKVRGLRVLYAGATDSPMTAGLAPIGELLHQKLATIPCSVIGVDLDKDAIALLSKDFGVNNIRYGDLENVSAMFPSGSFDVILAADVIEHLSNPGRFLEQVTRLLAPNGVVIISVPNQFSFKKFIGVAIYSEERNHPDHVCAYSPMNLVELLRRYGLEISEMMSFLIEARPVRRENVFANKVARFAMALLRNNNIADEWLLVAKPASINSKLEQ